MLLTCSCQTRHWRIMLNSMCFCKMNILLYGMKNAMPFKFFYAAFAAFIQLQEGRCRSKQWYIHVYIVPI